MFNKNTLCYDILNFCILSSKCFRMISGLFGVFLKIWIVYYPLTVIIFYENFSVRCLLVFPTHSYSVETPFYLCLKLYFWRVNKFISHLPLKRIFSVRILIKIDYVGAPHAQRVPSLSGFSHPYSVEALFKLW